MEKQTDKELEDEIKRLENKPYLDLTLICAKLNLNKKDIKILENIFNLECLDNRLQGRKEARTEIKCNNCSCCNSDNYLCHSCLEVIKQQARQGMIKIEDLKLWLEQFEKIVNWHKERSLLPYDWNDYEHKKIIELREILKNQGEK